MVREEGGGGGGREEGGVGGGEGRREDGGGGRGGREGGGRAEGRRQHAPAHKTPTGPHGPGRLTGVGERWVPSKGREGATRTSDSGHRSTPSAGWN